MNDEIRPPYRIAEAARRLGISDYLCRRAIKAGQLTSIRIGDTELVHAESVDRLLRSGSQLVERHDHTAA